jgi:hypothetical protein
MRDRWKDSCREDKLTRRIYRLDHDRPPMTGRDLLARFESLGVAWERRVRSDASQGQFIRSIVLCLRDETIAPAVRCAAAFHAQRATALRSRSYWRRRLNVLDAASKISYCLVTSGIQIRQYGCVVARPGPASLRRPLPQASVPSFDSGLQLGQPISDPAVGSLGVKVSRTPDLITDVEGSPS